MPAVKQKNSDPAGLLGKSLPTLPGGIHEAATADGGPLVDRLAEAKRKEIRVIFENRKLDPVEMARLGRGYVETYGIEHDVQKLKGLTSKIAKEEFVPGRSHAARRMWLTRNLKVARISPEAAKAASEASLDRYQSILLKIAEAGDPSQQMAMLEEIKLSRTTAKKKREGFGKRIVRFPIERQKDVEAILAALAAEPGVEVLKA